MNLVFWALMSAAGCFIRDGKWQDANTDRTSEHLHINKYRPYKHMRHTCFHIVCIYTHISIIYIYSLYIIYIMVSIMRKPSYGPRLIVI